MSGYLYVYQHSLAKGRDYPFKIGKTKYPVLPRAYQRSDPFPEALVIWKSPNYHADEVSIHTMGKLEAIRGFSHLVREFFYIKLEFDVFCSHLEKAFDLVKIIPGNPESYPDEDLEKGEEVLMGDPCVLFENLGKTLRPYQVEALRRIENTLPGSGVLELSVGAGKSFLVLSIFLLSYQRGMKKVLYLTHRKNIILSNPIFHHPLIKGLVRIYQGGQFPSVLAEGLSITLRQNFVSHFDKFSGIDGLIYDECHQESTGDITKELLSLIPGWKLGLTSMSNPRTRELFGDTIFCYPYLRGVKDGYVLPFYFHLAKKNIDQLIEQMFNNSQTKKGIIWLPSIDEANRTFSRIHDYFENLGINLVVSHSKTKDAEDVDRRILETKSNLIILAVDKFSEGYNDEYLDSICDWTDSSNPSVINQRRGRVVRKSEGKEWARVYLHELNPVKIIKDYLGDQDLQKIRITEGEFLGVYLDETLVLAVEKSIPASELLMKVLAACS
jgi:superfamily II DNA or RNA helicase